MNVIEKSALFNTDKLQDLTNFILQESLQQGASSAEVDMGVNKGFSVTVRMGEVESVEYHQNKGISLTVYQGKRCGTVSLSDIRPEAIRSAVAAACNIARYTDEDPYSGLAEKDLLAFGYEAPDIYFPWHISVEDAIAMALDCEKKALAQDKRICNSEGVSVTTSDGWSVYGNTHGFVGIFPASRHEISCMLIAKQGGDMQRDYYYTNACAPDQLDTIQTVALQAAERTVRRLGARRLQTCQAPVIFAAEEARGLLGHFMSAISGGSLYRKSSFLVDHLGKKIFPDHIRLFEQPYLAKGLGSSPFDDDGVATRPNVFVEDGVLQLYALGVYSARKLNMQTTGNAGGVHNLFVSTGKKDLAALLKTMNKGLLVTELMGQGVHLTTGDYSRGASGFWVENGEIQYPVQEITIASNLRDMYARLAEI
ncbi:metalloprotease PmbA, partial [Gammaproteobacteria bacterium SCGC AG-212-F23]